jgi:hypothetical protein
MITKPESTLPKSQLDKFKDAARELECDDDEQHFKDRLRRVAAAKLVNEAGGGSK